MHVEELDLPVVQGRQREQERERTRNPGLDLADRRLPEKLIRAPQENRPVANRIDDGLQTRHHHVGQVGAREKSVLLGQGELPEHRYHAQYHQQWRRGALSPSPKTVSFAGRD